MFLELGLSPEKGHRAGVTQLTWPKQRRSIAALSSAIQEPHMQKWIRDRMKRRKKKTGTDVTPANDQNPPLQPAYPESSEPGTDDSEDAVVNDAAPEPEVAAEEAASGVRPAKKAAKKSPRRRKKRKPEQPAIDAVDDISREEIAPVAPLTPRGSAHEESPEPVATATVPPVAIEEPETAPVPELQPVAAASPVQPAAPQQKKPQRASKGAVILAVGLPGSGKSTWFHRHGVSALSSDKIRELLFDNPTEQRHQDLVFGTLRSLLRARLIARMPMNYVDATNLSPKERRHWIKMAKDFGYEAQAVYFDVPQEVCMERNRRRNRVVPEDVMNRMGAKLRPPTFDEGFSKIIVVRVKQKAGEGPVQKEELPGHDEPAAETE